MTPESPNPPIGDPVQYRSYVPPPPDQHVHTWGRWRREVFEWDSMHTAIVWSGWAELTGVDRPVTQDWSRTCSTCHNEERS